VHSGRTVRAIDCNEEAVRLTSDKGAEAFTTDFFALRPEDFADVEVVYADGLLGHLFDAERGLDLALGKLVDLELRPGCHLVLSNDSPRDPWTAFAPHERVAGFWFISKDYLSSCLSAFGFEVLESYYFSYLRPISGRRNRTIAVTCVR